MLPLAGDPLLSEEGAEKVVVTITRIDLKPEFVGSSFVGRHKGGVELKFFLRLETRIRKIGAEEVIKPLGQFPSLPFRVGEEVQVLWKIDPATSQRTAVKITVIE